MDVELDGTVSKVNLTTEAVTTIEVGGQNRRIVGYGNRIFVAVQQGSVAIIDARADQLRRTIQVGGAIRDLALNAGGNRLFVSAYGLNRIVSYDVGRRRAPLASAGPPAPRRSKRIGGANVDVMFTLAEWRF